MQIQLMVLLLYCFLGNGGHLQKMILPPRSGGPETCRERETNNVRPLTVRQAGEQRGESRRGWPGGPLPFPLLSLSVLCEDPILTHLVLPVSREIPHAGPHPPLRTSDLFGQSGSQTETGTMKPQSPALCVPGGPKGQTATLQEALGPPPREPGVGCRDRTLLRGGRDLVEYVTAAPPAACSS